MKSYSHGLHDVHMASLFGGRIEGMEGRRKGRERDRKKKGERELGATSGKRGGRVSS